MFRKKKKEVTADHSDDSKIVIGLGDLCLAASDFVKNRFGVETDHVDFVIINQDITVYGVGKRNSTSIEAHCRIGKKPKIKIRLQDSMLGSVKDDEFKFNEGSDGNAGKDDEVQPDDQKQSSGSGWGAGGGC